MRNSATGRAPSAYVRPVLLECSGHKRAPFLAYDYEGNRRASYQTPCFVVLGLLVLLS